MAGPGATLQGWAIALVHGAPFGEHTYVTSDCGLIWGCRGRSAGGNPLSAAGGDSSIADCLSQPNSLAGIRYRVTGVCHQMANRILHPAGITVAGTQGYNLSSFAYGVFGRGAWPELQACYPPGTVFAGTVAVPAPPADGNLSLRISVYNSTVTTLAVATKEGSDVAELAAMAEMALGHPLEKPALSRLIRIQADLHRGQDQLVRWLDAGEITPEEYVARFDEILRVAMGQCRGVLGDERFMAIFGDPGLHPEGLGDAPTFIAAEEERKRREPSSLPSAY